MKKQVGFIALRQDFLWYTSNKGEFMNINELKELSTLCSTLKIKSWGELQNIKNKYGIQSNGELLSLLETMAAYKVA